MAPAIAAGAATGAATAFAITSNFFIVPDEDTAAAAAAAPTAVRLGNRHINLCVYWHLHFGVPDSHKHVTHTVFEAIDLHVKTG